MPTGLSLAWTAQEAADVQFVLEVMQTEGVWLSGAEALASGCILPPKVCSGLVAVTRQGAAGCTSHIPA